MMTCSRDDSLVTSEQLRIISNDIMHFELVSCKSIKPSGAKASRVCWLWFVKRVVVKSTGLSITSRAAHDKGGTIKVLVGG